MGIKFEPRRNEILLKPNGQNDHNKVLYLQSGAHIKKPVTNMISIHILLLFHTHVKLIYYYFTFTVCTKCFKTVNNLFLMPTVIRASRAEINLVQFS